MIEFELGTLGELYQNWHILQFCALRVCVGMAEQGVSISITCVTREIRTTIRR